MKNLKLLIVALILAWSFAAVADDRPINIRIELQVITVPEELAMPLVPDLMSKDKIEAANAKIQDMITKGVAKLIGWPIANTQSGVRAVVEAIHEFRYPTEYDPPTVSFTPGVDPSAEVAIQPKGGTTTQEGIPMSFETRNIGVTLEVEPVLSADGKRIDLNIVPQHVRFSGFRKATIDHPSTGGKIVVEQPDFDTMKVITSLTLRNGERFLMGVFRTNEPPKHIEFFLLKVDAIPVE